MKILTFSTLYPNNAQTNHGVFVENRMRHLHQSGELGLKVVAPVPWFPFRSPRFGGYARLAQVVRSERRYGIDVYHPRYPVIPKIGMTLTPNLLARAVLPLIKRIIRDGFDFDLLDAHYFYPDGVAAAAIAREIGKPLVITARGSDLNLISQFRRPRSAIVEAAGCADAVVTVCRALADKAIGLGVAPEKVKIARNGVDLENFKPLDRQRVRGALGFERKTLLSVGNLIELKGHHLAIEALRELLDCNLVIVGEGPDGPHLRRLASSFGLSDRVSFLGVVPHDLLKQYYSAADVLVLASSREGWANVLLESMACGTPVVATNIAGTAEVVTAPEAGVLIGSRSAEGIACGVRTLIRQYPDHGATRRFAEQFSWDDTTASLLELFTDITARQASRR